MPKRKMKRVLVLLDPEILKLIRRMPFSAKTDAGKLRSIIMAFLMEHHFLDKSYLNEKGKFVIPSGNIKKNFKKKYRKIRI